MPSKTITVTNGDGSTKTITIPDRSRFAGVRNISRSSKLDDNTTSIQVTSSSHPEFNGIYTTTSAGADSTWNQQGGNSVISVWSFNAYDGYEYILEDGSDGDPQYLLSNNAGFTDRPWKANLGSSVVITAVTETLTVDRTAQVVTSDRKGESRPLLSKVVGGASAAYSLRDLNDRAGNNKVVRVRRASDNTEKDFRAKEVKDIAKWANTQVVPPLDVRELVDGERTGALIPAAAAYSLRNLSTSYTGSVVDVRRSSDDAEDSFTAAEVADGTLEDWVNTNTNGVFANEGFEDFSGASESGFTAHNSIGSAAATTTASPGSTGDVVVVSFDLDISEGSPALSLRTFSTGGTLASNFVIYTESGNYTATFTATTTFRAVGFTEGDAPSSFTVSNFKILNDGFVTQWYDQSGNANHATQGTDASQPKIVDAGSLVSGGIDFDGVDDQLDFTALNATDLAIFSVVQFDSVSGQERILGEDSSNSEGFGIGNATNGFFRANGGSATQPALNATVSTSGTFLYSANRASNTLGFFTQGVASATATNSDSFNANSIGGSTNPVDGKIQEIIIYNSDQTDNRTAFEANIGETYGIDLPSGVDTGYDQVDGFVETWYDQSGNGNDATQSVAGSQPKIVNAGVLVRDYKNNPAIDFDGIDDKMDLTSSLATVGAYSCIAYHEFIDPTMILKGDLNVPRIRRTSSTNYQIGSYAPQVNQSFTVASTLGLVSVLKDASHNARVYANGTESSSGQKNVGSGSYPFTMLGTNVNDGAGDGKIVELIYYPSDQSANRVAIETNINNQYDIY